MSEDRIVNKVRALMTLINSRPRDPTEGELIEFELRWAQMPDMSLHTNPDGSVVFVAGDPPPLPSTRAFP